MSNTKRLKYQRTSVFVARYPFEVINDFIPLARREEIDNCGNSDTANSKYYAFKLLQIALRRVYNVDIADCALVRNNNGKWQCNVCQLSISHCNDIVVVAVSNMPVGVDVERIAPDRFDGKLQTRIFTQNETLCSNALTAEERCNYANRIWTVKEAVFKRNDASSFVPNKIDSVACADYCKTVSVNKGYYLTVTSTLSNADVEFSCLNGEKIDN